MKKITPPRFEDFGLTEEKYHAAKNGAHSSLRSPRSWASRPGCPKCRKVRRGVDYVIGAMIGADRHASRRYDEALSAYQNRLSAFRRYFSKP